VMAVAFVAFFVVTKNQKEKGEKARHRLLLPSSL
jgi:hypothetical protein